LLGSVIAAVLRITKRRFPFPLVHEVVNPVVLNAEANALLTCVVGVAGGSTVADVE